MKKPTARRATLKRRRPAPFVAQKLADADSGFSIVRLAYQHGSDPGRNLELRIAATAGANLYSFQVGGQELLFQPAALGDLVEQRAGTPIMFPTPNRVRQARMQFEGHTFQFEANNGENFIHGLARRRPWRMGKRGVTRAGAFAELMLDWDRRQPEFARFPIAHRLTVCFSLRSTGLRIAYQVNNRDRRRLPFGFGLHPYFRIPGSPADVYLQVPLARRMEAQDMLPTGKLLGVSGTAHDLRKKKSLAGLALDDVFLGMAPGKAASFELRPQGVTLSLSGSAAFTHLVVFTPPEKPFFCIENQTCSTDSHNLHHQGRGKVAHLQVVPPGKIARGHVDWTVQLRS